MRLRKFFNQKLGLSLLAGLLLGFSFPPFHFGWIAFVSFIPLIYSIDQAENYREVLKLSYLAFAVFNIVVIYWVGGWTRETDPFMMIGGAALILCHPFFFTVPILTYHFIRRRLGKSAILLFPFFYVSFEHLHSITEVAFPWLTVGYSQSYNLADIQIASLTGLFGLSFQVLAVNTVLAYALMLWLEERHSAKKKIAALVILGFVFIIIPELFGLSVLKSAKTKVYPKTIRVAIVQPNIDPYKKWSGSALQILRTYEDQTYGVLNKKPELAVWPETAVPFYVLLPQNIYFRDQIQSFIDTTGISLLSGVPLASYYSDSLKAKPSSHYDALMHEYYDAYNGAALFKPHLAANQTYGKSVLVPFAERIPYADNVPFLIKPLSWGVGISNWARGMDTTVFLLKDGITFSTVICYESIFPDYVRQFVKKGAGFLVIITNDGWFGNSSGPRQHAAYAIIRAVENHRSIVRSANTGISEFIDPFGRNIGKQTQLDEEATIVADVPVSDQITFYTRHGDWIAYLSEIFCVTSILMGVFLKLKNRN